ncbi:MAG TPA: hypothetical protein VML75_19725 [Kofleriaceae bacterium]|nr:hypothetical protein [Kofleriaceae bacterium]
MKKLTTIFAVALFGATLGFACGGSKQADESTIPENPCNPCTTEPAGDNPCNPCADDMGGDAYGGDTYGY